MMTSFAERYAPKKIAEIVDQKPAVIKLIEFLSNFSNFKKKAVMLYGPTGTGKTSSVYAIANELDYEVVELNADDLRNEESIESKIKNAIQSGSLFGKKKLVLIDEIEGFGLHDRGGLAALAKLIRGSNVPFVLIALDIWEQKIRALKLICEAIQFVGIKSNYIAAKLNQVLQQENIKCEPAVIEYLSKNSNGDLRAALNDLDTISAGKASITKEDLVFVEARPKEQKIFDVLQTIFKTTDIKEARDIVENIDMDFNLVSMWLTDNITSEYHTPSEIATAYNFASRADVFSGRIIRRQHWSLYKYVIDLMTAGISSAKKRTNPSFTRYQPPTKLNKLYRTKAKRMQLKSVAVKIANATHTSSHVAAQTYIPMLRNIFSKDKKQKEIISETFSLSPEEVDMLAQ